MVGNSAATSELLLGELRVSPFILLGEDSWKLVPGFSWVPFPFFSVFFHCDKPYQ